ncbi:helix-turn-helix transcriptional regulator [Flavobacterium sp.]|uniref:helix-turn-helix domain-containing protein n=1 Tax=Flavobacterium sp. TaxID=239 RepID=UPI0022BF61A2|nr:helix-turn-helix transcriptional regulator [Flavobacterium sp.]MCZ8144898.1 helix-turn-helix transcriptional regulator [Flavobacterium sp.]
MPTITHFEPIDIKIARKKLGLTQTEFGEKLGVSMRAVQSWESGTRNMPKSVMVLLSQMLAAQEYTQSEVNEPLELYENSNGNKFISMKSGKMKIFVKKVPVKAFGSYLTDFQNVEYIDDLEKVAFTVDHIGKGKYMCFEVEGDSMNGGGIDDTPDGAELLCRELGRQHWKDGFRDSQYGWVIVHQKTVLFKDIVYFDEENGDITCRSRSGLPQHKDFVINLNEVLQIFKVIKRTF